MMKKELRVGVLLFQKNILRDCMNEDREKAMVYIINFFNSRMSAMSSANRNKVKELIGLHEISATELVNKYIDLVNKNS
jgi:hypothetical protein